ncbi:hypothetical protein ABPG75_013852 [Micractinium tetrahymenae]
MLCAASTAVAPARTSQRQTTRAMASQTAIKAPTVTRRITQEARSLAPSALLAGLAAAQLALLPGAALAEEAAPAPAPAAAGAPAKPTAPAPAAVVAAAPAVKDEPAPKPATAASPAAPEAAPAAAPKPAATVAEAPAAQPAAAPAADKPKEQPKPAAIAAAAAEAAAAAAAKSADEVAVMADAPTDVLQLKFSFVCSVEVKDVKPGAKPVVLEPNAAPQPAAIADERQQQRQIVRGDSWDAGSGGGGGSSSRDQRFSIGSQLLVLLSADSAALELYQEGELIRHRVHTGYTVRRQQGKAQATYQRQGGGAHSVGGSIRARDTRRLFQAAAATLPEWAPEIAGCNLLLRSGTVRCWNELYHASNEPQPPTDRRDARWQAAGIGVRRPRLADVERVFAAFSYNSLEEV